MAVVGGGDAACQEAAYLGRMADKVFLVHRRSELRASAVVAQRVKEDSRIEILWDSVVDQIHGDNEVHGLSLKNINTGEARDVPLSGVAVQGDAVLEVNDVIALLHLRKINIQGRTGRLGVG